MARRNDIDWDLVETDYRVAQLSIRQIAEKNKTEPSTITRRAKKCGWERDLSAAVRAATKSKVRKAVIREAQHATQHDEIYATQCTQQASSEVDLAANANAAIILRQRKRISRLSDAYDQTMGDIEVVNSDPEKLEDIARLIEEQDPKSAESIKRLKTVTTRLNNLKTAAEIMARLTDAERTVFGLDEEKNDVAKKFGEGVAMGAADAYAKMLNG